MATLREDLASAVSGDVEVLIVDAADAVHATSGSATPLASARGGVAVVPPGTPSAAASVAATPVGAAARPASPAADGTEGAHIIPKAGVLAEVGGGAIRRVPSFTGDALTAGPRLGAVATSLPVFDGASNFITHSPRGSAQQSRLRPSTSFLDVSGCLLCWRV